MTVEGGGADAPAADAAADIVAIGQPLSPGAAAAADAADATPVIGVPTMVGLVAGVARCEVAWRVHHTSSNGFIAGSYSSAGMGDGIDLETDAAVFDEASCPAPSGFGSDANAALWRDGCQPRYMVLEWQSGAFDAAAAGGYSRDAVEAEGTATTGVACGRGASSINLHRCLDLFSQQEQLDAENEWFCPKCKELRQGTKQMQFWAAPPICIIHLKRFSASGMYRRKLDTPVDFPLEGLDLGPYIMAPRDPRSPPPVYDLVAVSNHFGSTGGGHYTAYARHSDDGKWYCYDDSHVTQVDEPSSVVTPAAYVLFYVQRGLLPGVGGGA
tara:strand:+ start:70 stop:1050 length:981 start_codon:yes stop_codon:yes gene_type:complete